MACDNDSICNAPNRAQHAYVSPLKQGCSSPARPNCATLSTVLTAESRLLTPHSSYEQCEDSHRFHDESAEDDCWGGSVLQSILSFITPQKKNVVSACGHEALPDASATKNACQSQASLNDQFEFSWDRALDAGDGAAAKSPTRVQDFPLLPDTSSDDHACNRRLQLQFSQESQMAGHPNSGRNQEDESPLPSKCVLPSKRVGRYEQHDVQESLQHLLDAAQHFEAESNFDAAITSLEEFVDKSQSLAGASFASEHSRATALHQLGILQWKAGNYFFSEHTLSDCLHLYYSMLDETNGSLFCQRELHHQILLEASHVLISLGRVHLSKGEGDVAMTCYDECVRRLASIPKASISSAVMTPARIFAQACVGAGRVLVSQGRLVKALKRYRRALKVQLGYQAGEEIATLSTDYARVPLNDVAETLSHLGRLHELQNDMGRATECHAQALNLYQSLLDPTAVDIGYASNNVGKVYLRLGHLAEAEEALLKAHQVFSLRLGTDHRNTADALLSIGQLQASQGRHTKALATFKRVLRTKPFGELLAATYHCIATSQEALFRLGKALKYYQREADILRETLPHNNLGLARLLHHMAKSACKAVNDEGEYTHLDEANGWLSQASEIYYCNEGQLLDNELLHLESSIEDVRRRMNRKVHIHN